MSEDDKPIFPRPNDKNDQEKQKLYQETRQKLETAENEFADLMPYCLSCGAKSSPTIKNCLECGAPLEKITSPKYQPLSSPIEFMPVPKYGPPPFSPVSYQFWLMVGFLTALMVILGFVIYFLIFR
jgi:hypothetical protein